MYFRQNSQVSLSGQIVQAQEQQNTDNLMKTYPRARVFSRGESSLKFSREKKSP